MKLFEYAVIFVSNGKDKDLASCILVPPKAVLSDSIETVKILAARAIPEGYLTELDQVQVIVRPF